MNKSTVLCLVFAVASAASAQTIDLQISSVNGEPNGPAKEVTVLPSDWVEIEVVVEGTVLAFLDVGITVSGPGTLGTSPEFLAQITFPGSGPEWTGARELDPGISLGVCAGSFGGISGVVVGNIIVHCDGPGDVVVSIVPHCGCSCNYHIDGSPYAGDWGTGVVIHQDPEPTCWDFAQCGGQDKGDATCDGSVNFLDLGLIKRCIFCCEGMACWEQCCCADFNHDGCVNFIDLGIMKVNFFTSGHTPATGVQNCPR